MRIKDLVVLKDICILRECGWGSECKKRVVGDDKVPMWVGKGDDPITRI